MLTCGLGLDVSCFCWPSLLHQRYTSARFILPVAPQGVCHNWPCILLSLYWPCTTPTGVSTPAPYNGPGCLSPYFGPGPLPSEGSHSASSSLWHISSACHPGPACIIPFWALHQVQQTCDASLWHPLTACHHGPSCIIPFMGSVLLLRARCEIYDSCHLAWLRTINKPCDLPTMNTNEQIIQSISIKIY